MELYILSKQDLSILSICKLADYQINLDEETNAKSTFTLMKTNGLKKGNYMTLNGLYRQFIFVIDDVQTEKESDVVTVTALDISNVFNRKVIEKNINTMKSKSIEEFLANTISENFVNSNDTALNVNYIEIYWHTNTQGNVATNAENGLYNFHTFLTNCRQYKNIYTDFKLENLGNPQTVEGKRISVEAKNRKIIDISLHGETSQETRSGKNKLQLKEANNTYNGLTWDITDEQVNINGTATSSYSQSSRIDCNIPAGTYKYIVDNTSLTYGIWLFNEAGTMIATIRKGETSVTTNEVATKYELFVEHTVAETTYDIAIKPMLLLDSETDTTYEPYGVMPSPHYPSEIECVKGKNLFNINGNRIDYNATSSIINDTLKIVTSGNYARTDYLNIEIPKTAHTISFNWESDTSLSGTDARIYVYDGATVGTLLTYSNLVGVSGKVSLTFTNTTGVISLRFSPNNTATSKTITMMLTNIQLEEGTVATPYVPYNSLEFKDVGSNVLELSKGTVTLNGVTLTSDGETITINGTVSGNYPAVKLTNGLKAATSLETLVNNYISERVAQLEDIKDCTIQSIISGGSSTFTPHIGSYNKTVRELWYGIGTPAKTIQTSSTSLIAIYLGGKGSTYNNYKIKIGINKGTVAKAYEPYQEQKVDFPLSEGQKLMEGSYLADDGIHHSRKQVVFDGTETGWYTLASQTGTNTSYFCILIRDMKKASTLICDKFINRAVWNTDEEAIQSIIDNYIRLRINTSRASTVAELKTWLSNNPIRVEYELAEEEIVPYTETQQEAWNNIKNLTLFEGVNHISSDANMVLKYYPLEAVGLKFVLRIDIENKQETTKLIDTTLPEVTDYNKIYEADVTAKVQVYIREDGSEYNLYLKTDRTTTTNKDDPDRASGKIEVISVETADRAEEEALNVMKGNNYKHLVEFKIAKTSKLMDITELHIGRPIRIKTDDDIYDSYISAITLSDENFVCFKSGRLRITLLDKLKQKFLQIT